MASYPESGSTLNGEKPVISMLIAIGLWLHAPCRNAAPLQLGQMHAGLRAALGGWNVFLTLDNENGVICSRRQGEEGICQSRERR